MADFDSVMKMRFQIRAIDKKGGLDKVNKEVKSVEDGFHVNCLLGDIDDVVKFLEAKPELFKKLKLVLNKESFDLIF